MKEKKEKKISKKALIVVTIILVLTIVASLFLILNKSSNTNSEEKNNIEEKKKEQITPLMYEITKEDSDNKIYLFGSIHLANSKEFDYPDYLINAYDNSDYLAVEVDMKKLMDNPDFAQREVLNMLLSDGTTIKDHISEDTYNKLVEYLKSKKIYNEALESYNTYFFSELLSELLYQQIGLNANEGVDLHFLNEAYNDKKEVLEVETYEFQSNLLNSFPDRVNELSIISFLNNPDKQAESLRKLYSAWKKGNPKEIEQVILDDSFDEGIDYTEDDIKLIDDYNQKLIINRNRGMKDKLEEYFNNNQKVLFIVGAAHLVGDEGIANLLVEDGYTVTQINK